MAESGRVRGQQNVNLFMKFINIHNKADDWGNFVNSKGTKLRKDQICEECTFCKSVFVQNPMIKAKLKDLEADLRHRGILVTESSPQSNFVQFDQAIFIKYFEDKLIQFKDSADNLKNLLERYSKELNQ